MIGFKYLPDLEQSRLRRKALIHSMEALEKQGIHCGECNGKCCTSVANSMQCTPLEALEIALWLKDQGELKSELEAKILQCIQDYRLDYEIPTTRGIPFRRTYTCPFFKHESLGCFLSRSIKPYGCLGFNPTKPGMTEGGDSCQVNQDLMEGREKDWDKWEQEINQSLRLELKLNWEKLPMPVALLDVMERLDIKWDQD